MIQRGDIVCGADPGTPRGSHQGLLRPEAPGGGVRVSICALAIALRASGFSLAAMRSPAGESGAGWPPACLLCSRHMLAGASMAGQVARRLLAQA